MIEILPAGNKHHGAVKQDISSLMHTFIVAIMICLSFLVVFSGCTSDDSSADKLPEDTLHGVYGKGSISLNVDGTPYFDVTGPYKPSNQFANDTASEGAGGFVKDTTLFGNKIQALLAGYYQKQDSLNLTQYLLVIGLCDTSTSLQTGVYPFAKNNHSITGRNTYIYFIRTDSSHFAEILVPKTGILSLSVYEPTDRHAQGSFSGTLWGLPPDTTITVNVTSGQFDLYLVNKFFNY